MGLNFAKQTVIVGFNFNTSNSSLIIANIAILSVNYVTLIATFTKVKNKLLLMY